MSNWIDYYLKAPDEASARAAARDADVDLLQIDEETGEEFWANYSTNRTVAFDPGITIWQTKPTFDEEGNVIDPGTKEDGWFANLRVREDNTAEADSLLANAEAHGVIIKKPNTPVRTWA